MTYFRLNIRRDTMELLKQCETVFRRHHPELDGSRITKNHILLQVCRYYLEE